ncbi:LicD family-domain-containing protein [Zopfochytrium polystomum]|nr:LicD family-domain-containing protein [Zopfochytrium polystomum]
MPAIDHDNPPASGNDWTDCEMQAPSSLYLPPPPPPPAPASLYIYHHAVYDHQMFHNPTGEKMHDADAAVTPLLSEYPVVVVRTQFPVAAASASPPSPRRRRHLRILFAACLVVAAQAAAFLYAWRPWRHAAGALHNTPPPPAAIKKCANSSASWAERPLRDFAISGERLTAPFEAAVAATAAAAAAAETETTGPYPTRNHFSTCDAVFADPFARAAFVKGGGARAADPYPEKFFNEQPGDNHLDARFGRGTRGGRSGKHVVEDSSDSSSRALRELFGGWTRFAAATNVTAWLAHGTLMGWWWAGGLLPWDDDVDLQVTLHDLEVLAALASTTSASGKLWEDRFLLEVNPSRVHRWREWRNIIDARFIDTTTGRFLDITALATAYDRGRALAMTDADPLFVHCKMLHFYDVRELFPLRRTVFEGVPALVPFDVAKVLRAEYGRDSVTRTAFKGYRFDEAHGRWEKADDDVGVSKEETGAHGHKAVFFAGVH